MQADAERTLNNLCILAAISHNDKLCTMEDSFDIYAPTSLRGLWRMWYGERRGQNVQRVRQTVRAAIDFAQKSLEEVNALRDAAPNTSQITTDVMRLRIDTMTLQHLRMVGALERSCGGLQNLLQTYKGDAALTSQLTLLIQEIRDFANMIRPHSNGLRCGEREDPSSPIPYSQLN